eukprot:g4371.t1
MDSPCSPPSPKPRPIEVLVKGRRFQVLCNQSTTNAWLVSEVIRLFIADAGFDPDINGLFNSTRGKDLDLSDDVFDCVSLDDKIEAREYTIRSTRETQATPSESLAAAAAAHQQQQYGGDGAAYAGGGAPDGLRHRRAHGSGRPQST